MSEQPSTPSTSDRTEIVHLQDYAFKTPMTINEAKKLDKTKESPSSDLKLFLTEVKFSRSIDSALTQGSNQAHLTRIQNLREELEYNNSTDWMYTPIDKILKLDDEKKPHGMPWN